eukprot:CAMPEP_0180442976 /NCGR_PEP_ID=MMETSP1036_2-20121128/14426_1 /TAXON_ID=632150 /ORGANISM="Azadinium spinosum, Strain 3D9" /LENGTH=63 /DNA_ID=CAMNT_0022449253 /DNA_START=363 /DNA_END=554 /DNA_ORIENTATION=+
MNHVAGHVPLVGPHPQIKEALRLNAVIWRHKDVKQRCHLADAQRQCQVRCAGQTPPEMRLDLM